MQHEKLIIRREGDAVQVGRVRVTVEYAEDGRALLRIEAPEGVKVEPAECVPAKPELKRRRESA